MNQPPPYGPPGYGPPLGYPPPPLPPPKKGLSGAAIALIVIGVLLALGGGSCAFCIFLGVAASSGSSKSASSPMGGSPSQPAQPAITVTAAELIAAYKANEISADDKYKGRLVNVASGFVAEVKKDILDKPYVAVGTGATFEFPRIQCHLRHDQVSRAGTLQKGARIAVRGIVSGLMGSVQIRDCTIL